MPGPDPTLMTLPPAVSVVSLTSEVGPEKFCMRTPVSCSPTSLPGATERVPKRDRRRELLVVLVSSRAVMVPSTSCVSRALADGERGAWKVSGSSTSTCPLGGSGPVTVNRTLRYPTVPDTSDSGSIDTSCSLPNVYCTDAAAWSIRSPRAVLVSTVYSAVCSKRGLLSPVSVSVTGSPPGRSTVRLYAMKSSPARTVTAKPGSDARTQHPVHAGPSRQSHASAHPESRSSRRFLAAPVSSFSPEVSTTTDPKGGMRVAGVRERMRSDGSSAA
mmetsp:Transcript_15078/g.36538  ORF Transcript_15078/g.36538 Transcript_15078/m.36538 type:complete len:273 (-) Transcript_15078:1340-2158(-)